MKIREIKNLLCGIWVWPVKTEQLQVKNQKSQDQTTHNNSEHRQTTRNEGA